MYTAVYPFSSPLCCPSLQRFLETLQTGKEFSPWDSAVRVESRHQNPRLGAAKQSLRSISGHFSEVGHVGLVLSAQAMTSQ